MPLSSVINKTLKMAAAFFCPVLGSIPWKTFWRENATHRRWSARKKSGRRSAQQGELGNLYRSGRHFFVDMDT